MSNIAISDLHPTDFDLLSDSEKYMRELSDEELNAQAGGSGSYDDLPFLTGEVEIGLTVDFNDLIRRALKLK